MKTFDDITALVLGADPNDDERRSHMPVVDESWEYIRTTAEHAADAERLLGVGRQREFFLIQLRDLAALRDRSTDQMKSIARFMSTEMGVPIRVLAEAAAVSPSTVGRWIRDE